MSHFDITIGGVSLVHQLYQFQLACSGFEHVHVVLDGESFVALPEGLRNTLWAFGVVLKEHRTDLLSCVWHKPSADVACVQGRAATARPSPHLASVIADCRWSSVRGLCCSRTPPTSCRSDRRPGAIYSSRARMRSSRQGTRSRRYTGH